MAEQKGWRPTNRQAALLAVMRELGGERHVDDFADVLRERTPCGTCQGTGEGDDHDGKCGRCFGRKQVPYYYSECYVDLQALVKHGLVTRRKMRNEWGDETNRLVYAAVPEDGEAADPLERLWRLPAE